MKSLVKELEKAASEDPWDTAHRMTSKKGRVTAWKTVEDANG